MRSVIGCLALAVLAAWTARPAAAEDGGATAPPVVVELFTSQGCSSCPPADRLLSSFGGSEPAAGAVVPLAFHVDYWDHLGWRDPFSSPRWSSRQESYASKVFASDGVYTPQVVVNGRAESVGSDRERILREIAEARSRPAAGEIVIGPPTADAGGGRVSVEVTARRTAAHGGKLDVMLVLFENGLVTQVGRGENARRTLANDFVVRQLSKLASLDKGDGEPRVLRAVVEVDPSWQRSKLGLAAFLQDPGSLEISGAAVRPLETQAPAASGSK